MSARDFSRKNRRADEAASENEGSFAFADRADRKNELTDADADGSASDVVRQAEQLVQVYKDFQWRASEAYLAETAKLDDMLQEWDKTLCA